MQKDTSFIKKITIVISIVFIALQGLGFIFFVSFVEDRAGEEILKQLPFIFLYEAVLLILLIFAVAVSFNKKIKKPISEIRDALGEIDKGNLMVVMQYGDCKEIMALTDAVNLLVKKFNQTIQRLSSTTRDVIVTVKQIEPIVNNIFEAVNKQLTSTDGAISLLKKAEEAKEAFLGSTRNLSEFSEENVSSLIEINSTGDEITESADELMQSSMNIYSTIVEVSDAAKKIAKSMEDLSISTEETAASIDELTASLKEIERSTKESAALTSSVREIASDKGMLTVTDAMMGMEDVSTAVVKSLELMRHLETKSRDIEKILFVITDITKQTNLLGLNAAILSLQAGEYGKGFAVVADEIKALADKTASSAKDITEIIKTTQTDINSALSVAEESMRVAEKGTSLVVRTGEAFREVIDNARESAELAKTIQKTIEEQVLGVAQINRAMEAIRQLVEDVTKATHKQEKGSEYILGISAKLKEISALLKRSMEEQNAGVRMISKNLELTNEKIKYIDDVASGQRVSDEELRRSIDNMKGVSKNALTIIQEMKDSLNTFHQRAEALIMDKEGFKLG